MSSSSSLTVGKLVLSNTTSNQDATDRLRITNSIVLYDNNSAFGKQLSNINELLTGTATSQTPIPVNISYGTLSCTTIGTISKAVSQSYEYVPYQSGSSKFVVMTGVLEITGGVNGSVSRIGTFDDSADKTVVSGLGNGHFFQLGTTATGTPSNSGTTMNVVERTYSTSTNSVFDIANDHVTPQTSWNIDKFDGKGPSGFTINYWGNAMIFVIDIQWLGVGRVRYGFYINGIIYYVHYITHSGLGTPYTTAIQQPYTQMAKLPVRYELITNTTTQSIPHLRIMCSSVYSENGFIPTNRSTSYLSMTPITLTSSFKPVLSISLPKSEPLNRMTIAISSVDIFNNSASNSIAWQLVQLSSDVILTGVSWQPTSGVAVVDTASTALTTLTGAVVLASGFVVTGTKTTSQTSFNFNNYLSAGLVNSAINGTPRVISLCCAYIGGAASAQGSLTWYEIF